MPTANNDWWRDKLAKNIARDADTDAHLRGLGWIIVRVWEHDTAAEALERIATATAIRLPRS